MIPKLRLIRDSYWVILAMITILQVPLGYMLWQGWFVTVLPGDAPISKWIVLAGYIIGIIIFSAYIILHIRTVNGYIADAQSMDDFLSDDKNNYEDVNSKSY